MGKTHLLACRCFLRVDSRSLKALCKRGTGKTPNVNQRTYQSCKVLAEAVQDAYRQTSLTGSSLDVEPSSLGQRDRLQTAMPRLSGLCFGYVQTNGLTRRVFFSFPVSKKKTTCLIFAGVGSKTQQEHKICLL